MTSLTDLDARQADRLATITRRAVLLCTAAMTGFAATVAVAAYRNVAATDDPALLALYREWDDLWRYTTSLTDVENVDALTLQLCTLEYTIADTPAQSPTGVLVKMRVHARVTEDSGIPLTSEGLPCIDFIQIPAALRDLERLVGAALSPAATATQEGPDSALATAADKYRAAKARREALPDDYTDEEFDAYADAKMEAYNAAMEVPARTMRGLGIKCHLYRGEMFPLVRDYMVDADLDALLGDIERLAGRAQS